MVFRECHRPKRLFQGHSPALPAPETKKARSLDGLRAPGESGYRINRAK